MKIGMLWFDDNPETSLREKIVGASEYYQEKYSCSPTVCEIHPNTLGAEEIPEIPGLFIRTCLGVLQDHFWIGTNEQPNG